MAPFLYGDLGRYAGAVQQKVLQDTFEQLEELMTRAPHKLMQYISRIDRELPKSIKKIWEALANASEEEINYAIGENLAGILGGGVAAKAAKGLGKIPDAPKTAKKTPVPEAAPPPKFFIPETPRQISNIHSVQTLKQTTYWGKGNASQPKTIALGNIDIMADLRDINAGKGVQLLDNDVRAPSGRLYGTHTDGKGIFPRDGQSGFISLNQAEFSVLQDMIRHGGLRGDALRAFEGMQKAKNRGITSESKEKLIQLYDSWALWHINK